MPVADLSAGRRFLWDCGFYLLIFTSALRLFLFSLSVSLYILQTCRQPSLVLALHTFPNNIYCPLYGTKE